LKKYIHTALLTLLCFPAFAKDIYGRRHYHIALHASSPLSIASKAGGGVEIRGRNASFTSSYYKYWGVYPGTQYDFEYDYFFRSRGSFSPHEYYVYAKGIMGSAAYDRSKMTMFGYSGNDVSLPETFYTGGGAGVGRRFNFNVFFISICTGLKYVSLDKLPASSKNMYNLFYYTGPGAYVDLHLQFGLQL
jgi:hypothetical protein